MASHIKKEIIRKREKSQRQKSSLITKRKGIPRKRFFLLLAAAISVSILLTILFYSFLSVVAVKQLNMFLIVGDHIGFDLRNDMIHFGMATRGGSSARDLILTNEYDIPLIVQIKKSGELAEWVSVENNLVLQKNETRKINISAHIPKNATKGNYSGELLIIFRRF